KAGELAALRRTLAAELTQRAEAEAQSSQAAETQQAQWRQERTDAQARYEAQAQAVVELNEHCRALEQRVQALTGTLAQARTELKQETESRKCVEATPG